MSEIEKLKKQVMELEAKFKLLGNFTTIPLNIDQAFRTRLKIPDITDLASLLTLDGIVTADGNGGFGDITPLAGTKIYYVSDSSGGAVTRKLTFTDGILTSQT